MGATVNCRVAVGVMQGLEETLYIMWSENYEKNCYPHTPKWSMNFIGNWTQFVEKVCLYSSSAEGGMLQIPSGSVTPESMVGRWMTAARNPIDVEDMAAKLSLGEGFYNTFRPKCETSKQALNWMRANGHRALVERMESGETLNVSLRENVGLILGLISQGVIAWQMFPEKKVYDGYNVENTQAAPNNSKRWSEAFPSHSFVRFGQTWDETALEVHGRRAENPKSRFQIMGDFVQNKLPALMLINPGCYRQAIKKYRESVQNAPRAEDLGYNFILQKPEEDWPQWKMERWEKAKKFLDHDNLPCGAAITIIEGFSYMSVIQDLYYLEKPGEQEQTQPSPQMTLDSMLLA